MRGVWHVGRVREIPIQIHWSFSLILIWSAYIGFGIGGWGYVGFAILLTILLFGCVLLHELGHALTAAKFGIRTRSITLLPIGGVAALNRIPERPREEFLITLAGPMVNVFIVGILFLIFGWPGDDTETVPLWSPENFGHMLIYTNMVMVVFNMLPAFPMDGGRLLRAVLAVWISYQKATAIASFIGQAVAIMFMAAGLFLNPFLILIGIMVYAGARTENHWVSIRSQLEGYTVRDFIRREAVVMNVDEPIKAGVQAVYQSGRSDFIVMNGNAVAGILPHDLWLQHLQHDKLEMIAGEVMLRKYILLPHDMPAYAMCRLVMSSKQTIFPSVQDGKFDGVITKALVEQLIRGKIDPNRKRNNGQRESVPSFIDVG